MAYEIETWESDRPARPVGGGESRLNVVRVANLASGQPVLVGILATLGRNVVRVTLSDTRGRMWDLWQGPRRDTDLDSDTRDLGDQRPAGAAVPKIKRRGGAA